MNNDYLLQLLTLQQDGNQAISAPTNWMKHSPLLKIETTVDKELEGLENNFLRRGKQNDTARWHFLIGSPGNGKSAAIGKLCTSIHKRPDCSIWDEKNTPLQDLPPDQIPYLLKIVERDEGKEFASAQIVQDASVVKNPYSNKVDPAKDFCDTLEQAWQRGISLLICTNRGVLEKAHRDNHLNKNKNSKPWFKILSAIVDAKITPSQELRGELSFDDSKTIFKKLKVSFCNLDNQSLLLNSKIFEDLLLKSIADKNWSSCGDCPSIQLCPFKANRDFLQDNQSRAIVIKILKRAEVFSGQVIVFREAIALISYFLSGCPQDYGSSHPCDWVKNSARSGDIFSLATRRIYMSLFSSHSPFGLETLNQSRATQIESLNHFMDLYENSQSPSKKAIKHVVNNPHPSTDVGVQRLLGKGGVISDLSPWNEALPESFYEQWDSDYDWVLQENQAHLTPIEIACISIWKELEQKLEIAPGHKASEMHWSLRRWSSNFLLHYGALIEARTAWGQELDEFSSLLELMNRPYEEFTTEEKLKKSNLDDRLDKLLNSTTEEGGNGSLAISSDLYLGGRWIIEKLKPQIMSNEESGSVSLAVKFEGGERATFGASMFLWLNRLSGGRLDPRCFPSEILMGAKDARIRAATKGKYAFEPNSVEITIKTGKDYNLKITRIDSEVAINHD
jgi:hypothetical protein